MLRTNRIWTILAVTTRNASILILTVHHIAIYRIHRLFVVTRLPSRILIKLNIVVSRSSPLEYTHFYTPDIRSLRIGKDYAHHPLLFQRLATGDYRVGRTKLENFSITPIGVMRFFGPPGLWLNGSLWTPQEMGCSQEIPQFGYLHFVPPGGWRAWLVASNFLP